MTQSYKRRHATLGLRLAWTIALGIVMVPLLSILLMLLFFLFLDMSSVGVAGFLGYVSFGYFRIEVSDAATGQPVQDADVAVLYRAWEKEVFDSSRYDMESRSFSTNEGGKCTIERLRLKGRRNSIAGRIGVEISHPLYNGIGLEMKANEPVPEMESGTGIGSSSWSITGRTAKVVLEPRQYSLHSNRVAAVLAEGDYVYAGCLAPDTASNSSDLMWSRYDSAGGRWELEATAPAGFTGSSGSLPRLVDAHGDAWEIVIEDVEDPPARTRAPSVVHSKPNGEVVRSYPLYPHVAQNWNLDLAVSDDAMWVGAKRLFRVDRNDGSVTRIDEDSGLRGFVSALAICSDYLYIGTNDHGLNRLDPASGEFDYFYY